VFARLLSITATDLEVELVASTTSRRQEGTDITVPGAKFLDILRALPEKLSVSLNVEAERWSIRRDAAGSVCRRSPRRNFGDSMTSIRSKTVAVPRKELLRCLEKTHFSMAQQDVATTQRHAARNRWHGAARSGDRRTSLGVCESPLRRGQDHPTSHRPPQGVLELQRVLTDEGVAELAIEQITFERRSAIFASHRS